MKVWYAGLVALSFCCACVRFGYDAQRASLEKPDASRPDGGTDPVDAAMRDAGAKADASETDASISTDSGSMHSDAALPIPDASSDADAMITGNPKDASGTDSATPPMDSGSMDAAMMDSGTMDSGTMDSGTTDAGTDAGKDNCPERADSIFCDGFENAIGSDAWLAKWPYDVRQHGALSRSTMYVHGGAYSLRATTTQNTSENSQARYGAEPFNAVMTGELWVRAWYYMPSTVNVTGDVSTLVLSQIEMPYFGFSLIAQKTRLQIGSLDNYYPDMLPSTTFPKNQWTCIELHVIIDPSAGTFEAYLDGTLKVKATGINTLPATGYTNIDVGIHYTNTIQGPAEVYVDDVVAGFQRAGCN